MRRTPKLVLHARLPISARSSVSICGRPPGELDFQKAAKAGPMPTYQRLRLDNRHDLQDRRKPSIHPDEEPAVAIRELGPASYLALQDDQLMSENRILRLKPSLRLEWRGQHGQNKANQRDHLANLADSIIR